MDAAFAAILVLSLFVFAYSVLAAQQTSLSVVEGRSAGTAEALAYSENNVDGGGQYCVMRIKKGAVVFCGQ